MESKYDPDAFFSAERNRPPLLWRDDLITTSEFMTHSGQNGYELHFRTPDREKYLEVQEVCRKVIEHGKPRTNADRIRKMSDEELARFIFRGCDGRKCVEPGDNESIPHQCERCWLEWLQQEV